MHTTGSPPLASSRASQGVIDPLSRPIFASFPPQRCKAPHNASGCVSTTPRHTILPASSTTHTAVCLKPTSSPANILIAALLPSLEESPAERVAFPPESSNLMYGMYYPSRVADIVPPRGCTREWPPRVPR